MSHDTLKVEGIIPALITPMNDDESINIEGLRIVIDYVIKRGVHGIFVLGSQGESFALTLEEKKLVIEKSIEASDGRVPVYVGTGMISTAQSVRLTKIAKKLGADAVSVITPYFIKPSQKELIEHYKIIAESADGIPVLLYNNPMRTSVVIDTETVATLAQIDNVVGMKDSGADLVQTMSYIDATRNMDFSVLVGNDASIFAVLTAGGKGSVAATANVAPELIVNMYNAVKSGDLDQARELQYRLLPVRKAFALGTFPLVIKEAMNMMGLPAGPARLPIQKLSSEKREELKRILLNTGILVENDY